MIKGRSKPFANSRESELAFDLRDIHLGKYLDYAPMRLPVEVISGALDLSLIHIGAVDERTREGQQPVLALWSAGSGGGGTAQSA